MHHFFVNPDQIGQDEIVITGPDVSHIKNALRMKIGEELRLCTGQDAMDYRCRIGSIENEKIITRILWAEENGAELPSRLVLYQSLPKSDKMELIVQKAVELGAWEIVPVESERCVVRLTSSRAENKIKRWNAISLSAAKQAKRMHIPEVHNLLTYSEALTHAANLDHILIPYERAEDIGQSRAILQSIRPGESVGIFIGPEGGFEEKEVAMAMEAGAKPITLGKRILRTETAGMCVLSLLMFMLEQ